MDSAAGKLLATLGWLAREASSPEVRRRCFWRLVGGFVDAFTIGVSVADIVTDVLVLLEFHELGYGAFFGASLGIFALAQTSYAFLFAATFASHRSALARVVVFLVALPFAQLVPVFTWLEAMHLPNIDAALRRFGLEPTAASPEAPAIADAGDSLWGFLQSKYQSHAGFLVEAFVEAVPQAVLQTAFVVVARRGTALNAVSVAISVFTIASKGYLVSYALDVVTFLFNFLCIAADSFGLFACTTLLALRGLDGALASAYAALSAAGLVLCVAAGHSLLWFIILDDHLKLLHPLRWRGGIRGVSSVFFDLYIVRIAAWFLAIVPCIVLFAGARLSLVPVCVLRSIDPDLVRHARFYRGLASFLDGRGGGTPGLEARLWTANTYIARARSRAGSLIRRLERATQKQRPATVQRWAEEVGFPEVATGTLHRLPPNWRPTPDAWGPPAAEDDAVQRAILESLRSEGERAGSAASLRASIRRLRAVAWLESRARGAWRELQERSEVFGGRKHDQGLLKQPLSWVLRRLAMIALAVTLICAVPLALGHSVLVLLGIVFPVVHAVPTCLASGTGEEATMLPCGLALSYSAVVLSAVALAPVVLRRQLVWMELADLRGFPDAFYGGAVLVEVRKRHLRDTMLRKRLGHFLAQHTLKFIEE